MLFVAASSQTEVLGQNIISYIGGMGAFEMMGKRILQRHGIEEPIEVERWYNHQKFLDALREIEQKTGPHTISVIGTRIGENALFSRDVKSLEQALMSLDDAYQVNHRGDTFSHKDCQKVDEHTYRLRMQTPYPCELDLGYLRGLANKYPEGINAVITHDDLQPCRRQGADHCTYLIRI